MIELSRHKLDCYKKMYMLPQSEYNDPGRFKFNKREELKKKHGKILATVGDQCWDVMPTPTPRALYDLRYGPRQGSVIQVGKNAEMGILLPAQ